LALLAILEGVLPALAVDGVVGSRSPSPTTYAIQYHVTISARRFATAAVRWQLAGIDEIRRVRLRLDGNRFYAVRGSGTVERNGSEIVWTPGGPYARLEYEVRLRHRRAPGKGYDAYATSKFWIGRAQDLFPRTTLTFELDVERKPSSSAEVHFHLPPGWQAYTAMERTAPSSFRPLHTGKHLDRPTGWIALGRLEAAERRIGRTRVQVVKTAASGLDVPRLLELYEKALPLLTGMLHNAPATLLIVSGANPMWRGGLSGESSIFLHGARPIRTPDRTSPPLHELFHVLAPFRPGPDGHWVTEGLAEYYSLDLQRRVGMLDDADYRKGLALFERYGHWKVNLAAAKDLAATNNSAPLVLAAIDHRLRSRSDGRRGLDDAVRSIATEGGRISTARFLRAVNETAKADFTSFFQRHVYAGVPPELPELSTRREDTP
jgi:hypothetical protein